MTSVPNASTVLIVTISYSYELNVLFLTLPIINFSNRLISLYDA